MNESIDECQRARNSKWEMLLWAPSCAPLPLQVQASCESKENTVVDSNDLTHQGLTCVTVLH